MHLIKYVIKNKNEILLSIFSSSLFFYLIYFLLDIRFVAPEKKLIEIAFSLRSNSLFKITFVLSIFSIALIFKDKIQQLMYRYKNTFNNGNLPVTNIEYFILSVSTISLLFLTNNILLSLNTHDENIVSAFYGNYLLLPVLFLSFYIIYLYSEYSKIKLKHINNLSSKNTPNKDNICKEPITSIKNDLLERETFINDFYNSIINNSSNESFTIGLYGSRGEGKSSAINLLYEKFNKEVSTDYLIVNFDPWCFNEKESILKGFYKQIDNEVNKYFIFNDLKYDLRKYTKELSYEISTSGLKVNLGLPLSNNGSAADIKARIQEHIEKLKYKKIIIIVDDVDRLETDEIFYILKLIRLNSNFKNTLFILSLDKGAVDKKISVELGNDYLEKFIIKPIPLPGIREERLEEIFIKEINAFLDTLDLDNESKSEFVKQLPLFYKRYLRPFFRNLRDIIIYIEGLKSTLSPIKSEINFTDFFILEIIRINCGELYTDIWKNREYYIPQSRIIGSMYALDDPERFKFIKEHIEAILGKIKKENPSIYYSILFLLRTIFPLEVEYAYRERGGTYTGLDISPHDKNKKITHPARFEMYFTFLVPPNQIPDKDIEITLNKWESDTKNDTIKKDLKDLKNNHKLYQFISKMTNYVDKISSKLNDEFIKAVSLNTRDLYRDSEGFMLNQEFNISFYLLLLLINNISDFEKLKTCIKEIVNNSDDMYLVTQLVALCRNRSDVQFYKIYDTLGEGGTKELKDLARERFHGRYIKDKIDIFDDLPGEPGVPSWLTLVKDWISDWGDYSSSKEYKIVNDYIFDILKDRPKKLIIVLNKFKRGNLEQDNVNFGNLQMDVNAVLYLSRLYELANKFKYDSSLIDEEKKLIDIFIKRVKPYIGEDGRITFTVQNPT